MTDSVYPGALDTFVDPANTDPRTAPSHGLQHRKANDALAAIETLLGINGTAALSKLLGVNAQSGTTYTFVLADAGEIVTGSNGSASTFSIPTNASVAYAIGTVIYVAQVGTGQLTINAVTPGTTTVESTGATSTAPKLRAQYSSAALIKIATDTWLVVGDIA